MQMNDWRGGRATNHSRFNPVKEPNRRKFLQSIAEPVMTSRRNSTTSSITPSSSISNDSNNNSNLQRSRRMFGMLMGHLGQAKKAIEKDAHLLKKKSSLEHEVEENNNKKFIEYKNEKKSLLLLKKQLIKLENENKIKIENLKIKHELDSKLETYYSKFIQTKSKPSIYYLPGKHTVQTNKLIKDSIQSTINVNNKIKKELNEIINELQNEFLEKQNNYDMKYKEYERKRLNELNANRSKINNIEKNMKESIKQENVIEKSNKNKNSSELDKTTVPKYDNEVKHIGIKQEKIIVKVEQKNLTLLVNDTSEKGKKDLNNRSLSPVKELKLDDKSQEYETIKKEKSIINDKEKEQSHDMLEDAVINKIENTNVQVSKSPTKSQENDLKTSLSDNSVKSNPLIQINNNDNLKFSKNLDSLTSPIKVVSPIKKDFKMDSVKETIKINSPKNQSTKNAFQVKSGEKILNNKSPNNHNSDKDINKKDKSPQKVELNDTNILIDSNKSVSDKEQLSNNVTKNGIKEAINETKKELENETVISKFEEDNELTYNKLISDNNNDTITANNTTTTNNDNITNNYKVTTNDNDNNTNKNDTNIKVDANITNNNDNSINYNDNKINKQIIPTTPSKIIKKSTHLMNNTPRRTSNRKIKQIKLENNNEIEEENNDNNDSFNPDELKVTELQKKLKKRGLDTKGRKADLIKRLKISMMES